MIKALIKLIFRPYYSYIKLPCPQAKR